MKINMFPTASKVTIGNLTITILLLVEQASECGRWQFSTH